MLHDGFIMEMEAMCRQESTMNGAEEGDLGEPLGQPVKVLLLLIPYPLFTTVPY